MFTGRSLSEATVRKQIENGFYARNIHEAIRLFGVNFIPVSPIYDSCVVLLSSIASTCPDDRINAIEPNCVYVKAPN